MCRTVPLHFEKEVEFGRFQTYKYILDEDAFDRLPNEETDCYKGDYTQLPNGLTDVSKCFFGECSPSRCNQDFTNLNQKKKNALHRLTHCRFEATFLRTIERECG